MGDGKVAMILDTAGIAEFSNLYFTEGGEEERRRREEEARNRIDALGRRQSILLFNNANCERFAFKLEEISRLEKINPDAIHSVGTQDYLEYRQEGLPIIHLEKLLPVSSVPNDADELFVIIPKTNGVKAGILVSRILDTVETQVIVQKDATTPPGVYGSAFIDGKLTMFLNPHELLHMFETLSTPVQKDRKP
jgi:chemotaxis protein histidine kinase CheA